MSALPATLIAGFAGPGKSQVIAALLQHRPAHEEWALIAPASLLGAPRQAERNGLWVETVAPGCPCCTGLTPFSAGLTALLRRLRGRPVRRLLIEGGAEGHITTVAQLLARPEFAPHVRLSHALAVIDPAWLENPAARAREALRELARPADSLVAAPWDETPAARQVVEAFAHDFTPPKNWAPVIAGGLALDYARAALPDPESHTA